MNLFKYSTIALILLLGLIGCASTKPDFDSLEQQGHEVRVYEVFGMDCPGCHDGLQNLVNNVAGVRASMANWEKKELRVVIEQGVTVTDEAIHDAIERANFTPGKRIK